MKCRCVGIFLLFVFKEGITVSNDECDRFGPEAFKNEIFSNYVKHEISLLKKTFFPCLESLKEIAEQNSRKDIENLPTSKLQTNFQIVFFIFS